MAQDQPSRQSQGFSNMIHAGRVMAQLREAYVPRFGEAFTQKMVSSGATLLAGAWIMLIGVAVLILGTIVTIALTQSIPDGFLAAVGGFAVIIVGFIVQTIGKSMRSAAVAPLSEKMTGVDSRMTEAGAARLTHAPQLYDRWLTQHPTFRAE